MTNNNLNNNNNNNNDNKDESDLPTKEVVCVECNKFFEDPR